ncbi:MAG: hypothetical protein ACI4EX_08780 [Lachnospiraceae bacterium]
MKINRIIGSLLVIISLCLCVRTAEVQAAGNQSRYDMTGIFNITSAVQARAAGITMASLYGNFTSGGLEITCNTKTSDTASTIGVKNVRIQHYNGSTWDTIASHPGGSFTNTDAYEGTYTCSGGFVKGDQYRLYCVHYAYINGTYYCHENYTGSKTY